MPTAARHIHREDSPAKSGTRAKVTGPARVRVSVVVCTRNRPTHIGECVESILANEGNAFELLVVDQSDDDATEQVLAPFMVDSRFRYLRTSTRGLSIARNVGIEMTSAPLVAFTDDDCRVPEDWVSGVERIFDGDEEAGVVFGSVSVPSDLPSGGYVPGFEPSGREYQHGWPSNDSTWGIGANMSFRRSVFDQLGTFDPMLGAGARFAGAEETDLTIRALAAGLKVIHAKEISLLHLGVRVGEDASKLMRTYGLALGAAFTKHVRLGTKDSRHLLWNFLSHHIAQGAQNAITGRRPTGLGFALSLLLGVCRSYKYRVDREHRVYAQGRS
jgi:glycosyltransferase involved in cell wall biosynthesis